MKPSKFVQPLLLSLLLMLPLSAPALALEDEPPEGQEPVSVCSLDELLTTIESAENGDTIILQNKIVITENCTIGQEEKHITIIPENDFNDDTMIEISPFEEQDIVLQNLILDGREISSLSALSANFYYTSNDVKGNLRLSNIQVENFISSHSNIFLKAISATVEGCHFNNNAASRTAGIEIAQTASAEISDCAFSGNISSSNGGALHCRGQVRMKNCDIIENQASNPNTVCMGGGICVEDNASCEITDCQISGNTAGLGGGIAVFGEATIVDTLLYHNQGTRGASDIRSLMGAQLSLTYYNGMQSVYTDNDPVGFYADDFENPFDAESNAVFLGESLTGAISNNQFGAKFIFASDLPDKEPDETENPNEQEPPTEPQEPPAPDANNTPTTPDKPDEDIVLSPVPSRPSRPVIQTPPIIQQEETPMLKLACGGAVLDASTPVVLIGYGDGQLHENDPITRAQIAVLLYRALTDDSKVNLKDNTVAFGDTGSGAWYDTAVNSLASVGVIGGHNGLFHPDDTLTIGQLITLLTRFVEARETAMPNGITYQSHWAYENIMTAVAHGWIEDAAAVAPNRPLTRGEAIELINSIFAKCQ